MADSLTPERIAELRALVAKMSAAEEWEDAVRAVPRMGCEFWHEMAGPLHGDKAKAKADAAGIVALRNDATALLDLAEEALRLRSDVASARRQALADAAERFDQIYEARTGDILLRRAIEDWDEWYCEEIARLAPETKEPR